MFMPESTIKIPVASRRQAMDWSLVLASQGIEPRIEASSDTNEWWLEIAAQDHERALDALRRYQRENRRWPLRTRVAFKGLPFDWASLSWVVLVTVFFWASSELPGLRDAGTMDSAAFRQGEWWRVCTAVWLHGDVAHLAGNASIGLVLLGLAMGLYGAGAGLLAGYLAGIGGNLIGWMLATEPHRSLGASGMVMGCIGLLAGHALFYREARRMKLFLTSLAGAVMLFTLLGLSPGTDIVAHAGGAVSGLLIGSVFSVVRIQPEHYRVNLFCGALFCLLTLVPWAIAMLSLASSI